MTRFALSTMYAQHERFTDGAAFARFAAQAGYDALEISHSTPVDKLRGIVEANILPIVAVHQPAPWEETRPGIANADLNLASLDREHRDEALYHARRSIETAARIGAGAVVLHLGHLDDPELIDMDRRLRRRPSGERLEPGALRRKVEERRSPLAEPHLAAARSSLSELVEFAGPHGIVLGVENRIHFHEIPLPAELPALFDGVDPDHAGYWHDTGHADVLDRLGYVPLGAWMQADGIRCVGAHVHDVDGVVDHRAPGRGDSDLAAHLPLIGGLDTWTLEIDQHEPDEAVSDAPDRLRELVSRAVSPG